MHHGATGGGGGRWRRRWCGRRRGRTHAAAAAPRAPRAGTGSTGVASAPGDVGGGGGGGAGLAFRGLAAQLVRERRRGAGGSGGVHHAAQASGASVAGSYMGSIGSFGSAQGPLLALPEPQLRAQGWRVAHVKYHTPQLYFTYSTLGFFFCFLVRFRSILSFGSVPFYPRLCAACISPRRARPLFCFSFLLCLMFRSAFFRSSVWFCCFYIAGYLPPFLVELQVLVYSNTYIVYRGK